MHVVNLKTIIKWRLGAWDIQELPLLAQPAPRWIYTPKCWQPSHEPPRQGKQAPVTLTRLSGERRETIEGGGETLRSQCARKTMLCSDTLVSQEHMYEILAHTCLCYVYNLIVQ